LFRSAVIILAIAALVSACANKSSEELYKEGLKMMKEHKPAGAIVLFKNALQKEPNHFDIRFQLARAYSGTDNLDSAEKELKKVIRQNPSFRDAHLELARVYLRQSRPEDALSAIGGLDQGDSEVIEVAGLAHAAKGQYEKAEELLKRAYSSGGRAETAVAISRVYMKTGRAGEAREQISEVLHKHPENRRALYTLAELHTGERDFTAAIETYGRISRRYPGDREAIIRMGMLLIEKGDYDQALSISDGLIMDRQTVFAGYKLRGAALFREKDFDGATVSLQKAVSVEPDAPSYYLLGLCHYYKGEPEQALSQLYRALDIAPSHVQARTVISLILLKQKRVEDAIAEARKAIEADGESALAHNVLGSAYIARGDYDEGLEELNKAMEIDPTLVDVHIKKGLFKFGRGEVKEAESELRSALSADPDALSSRVILASLYKRNRDYAKALKTLQEGLGGAKTDAVLHNIMADVLLKQGKAEEAAGHLKKAIAADPDYASSYLNLASIYFFQGRKEEAVAELKSSLRRSPTNLKTLFAIAGMLAAKGDDEEALQYLRKAEQTGKPEAAVAMARYRLGKNQPREALSALDRAIEKNPSSVHVYEMKGMILMSLGKYPEAIEAFERVEAGARGRGLPQVIKAYMAMKRPEKALDRLEEELGKHPGNPRLMVEMSAVYRAMGDENKALDSARRAISSKPGSPVGYLALASLQSGYGDTDGAIKLLKDASREVKDDTPLKMFLGELYQRNKEYAASIEIYRAIEKSRPGFVPAIFKEAAVLHEMGRREESISGYQRALSLSKGYVPALNNLAYIYAEDDKELDRALQMAARAYVMAPGNGPVADTLGFVLLKSGKAAEALSVLEKASRLLPDDPSVHYHLALAYRAQGNRPLAVESLEKALALRDFPEAGKARDLLTELKKG
jgi:putative PEP-CTERM system TPR-repeat lipoprotein